MARSIGCFDSTLPQQVVVIVEPLFSLGVARAGCSHVLPKARRMIHLTQVHQFVNEHVFTNVGRRLEDAPIEANRAAHRTRSPARTLTTHQDAADLHPILLRQFESAWHKLARSNFPQTRSHQRSKVFDRRRKGDDLVSEAQPISVDRQRYFSAAIKDFGSLVECARRARPQSKLIKLSLYPAGM